MSGDLPAAGWYPDPERPGQQRYWDGVSWTDARQPDVTAPPPPPAGYAPPTGGYSPYPTTSVGYGVAAGGTPPDNYLVWAILSTVLCCLPAGIVSIVKSSQVNSKWNAGDAAGAQEASRQARMWAIVSASASTVVILVYVLVLVVGASD